MLAFEYYCDLFQGYTGIVLAFISRVEIFDYAADGEIW